MIEFEEKPPNRRWMLIILGIFLALIVLVVGGAFVVGSRLDERITSTVSWSMDASPEAVWAVINDYEKVPVSGAMRKTTTVLPDEPYSPAWQEDIGNTVITIRTVESEEPSRLVRTFEDSVIPITAHFEYLLEPEGDGTKVTINATTIIRDGTWQVPIFRMLQHMAPDAGSEAYLADVEAHL